VILIRHRLSFVSERDGILKCRLALVKQYFHMPLESAGLFERVTAALGTRSVEQIAENLKLSKQSVYLWRKGKPPSMETLIQIADSSKTSLHWLITGKGSEKVSDDNGSSQPQLQTEPPESKARLGYEERERVRDAQMQLIIEQNNRIIQLLEELVSQK